MTIDVVIVLNYLLLDYQSKWFVISSNEAEVARALRKSSVKRDDVFVVSKVWINNHGYDAATASVKESLSKYVTNSIYLSVSVRWCEFLLCIGKNCLLDFTIGQGDEEPERTLVMHRPDKSCEISATFEFIEFLNIVVLRLLSSVQNGHTCIDTCRILTEMYYIAPHQEMYLLVLSIAIAFIHYLIRSIIYIVLQYLV